MKRLGVLRCSLAKAIVLLIGVVTTPFVSGAPIYRPAAIGLDEVRSPTGQSRFILTELGAQLPGERFINPLGESSSHPTVYDNWESVAARLFGEWKFVTKSSGGEEIYTFTMSPFAYADIVEPFPAISPAQGATVASPFTVTVENGTLAGMFDGALPRGWEWSDVSDVERQWLGNGNYRVEFGQAGPNARILFGSRSTGTHYLSVAPVTPPLDPSYLVSVSLMIARGTEVEVFPVNVPEPCGLSLSPLLVGAAWASRRLRRS